MGSLIRSMDWSKTSLGPVVGWPQSLRTTVSICLASDLPICVIWGPGLAQLYNDAYRVICGDKHPRSMGQNFSECWKEAWPVIGEAHDCALAGDKAFLETQHVFLERHGFLEECFFTFSFSPIRDETGRVGGLFHPVIEMTTQMLGQRRTRALRDLTAQTSKAKSVTEVLALSAQTLAEYALDLPFVLIYALEPRGHQARLVGATGLSAQTIADLRLACSGDAQAVWPLEDVVRLGSAVQVDDVRQRITGASPGPNFELPNFELPNFELPDAALAHPIIPPGTDRPVAILIAGISPRLPMNEAYRSFYDLLASGVTTSVANVSAYEDELRRAKALAELDRAKTAFFSNISHEFRTPLTLMLGPVEDALAGPEALPPLHREQLEVVHRNGLRLQRLVNGLLEFSRIEAGRVRAAFEPTDLAEFTADLASNFRSACEKAGLKLRVDCPRFSEPVFVDRPMWEKIVLNLLSNAFKFTFDGEIAVTLRQAGRTAELVVRDSGTGIPAVEMPRLFERFHRVENAQGRTHEGSGIGLALVQELVKLHGGTISAESKAGSDVGSEAVSEAAGNAGNVSNEAERGTTFHISIPLGTEHLAPEQVRRGRISAPPSVGANPFVQEALRWLPDAEHHDRGAELPSVHDDLFSSVFATQQTDADRPRVLVADDNVDMRRYIERLLSGQYQVETVPDGDAALAAVRQRIPDLILTDVMMPRLDGFGLLRALRCAPHTAGVPVILLSARAGEESRVEGMEAGADAYLVKPFSAKELLARVGALLQITRLRQEADKSIRASEERFRALVSASSDVIYRMSADWTEMRHLQGREFVADTHEPSRSWLLKYIAPDDQPLVVAAIDAAIRSKGVFELEHRVMRADGTAGWTFSRAIPLLDGNGEIMEWFGAASDVTPRKQAEAALRQSEERFRTLFESMDEGFCVIEMILAADSRPADYRFLEVNPAFEKHTGLHGAAGRRMLEMAPGHDPYWFEIYGRVAVTGEPIRFVREAKALENRWFDIYAFRLGSHGSHKVAILFNDISDRKASEDALIASENRSRNILESITDGFLALDRDWRITYINAAGARFLDRNPGDLIGKSLWEEFPGTVGSEYERVYRRVVAGRVGESFTAYYPSFDRWYELTAYPAPDGLLVYFRDITTRRQVEQERQQFAALVDASPDFIGVAGLDQRGVYVNRAGQEMSGLEPGQVASISVLDFFPESERDRILGFITDSEAGENVVVDTWFQHLQTGQLIPVSWSFLRLRDASGNVSGYATVTRDLTERNKAEELLRASEERRRLALDAAELGMWHVEPVTRATKTDARYRAIFGTTEEWTDYFQAFAVIHPDDLPAVKDAVAAATRLDNPAPYAIEYRIVHSDGSLRWIVAKGRASFEGVGPTRRVASFNGTVADISDRKRGEEEREQLVARLQEQDVRKDEFLAILAHELRNPLAPIRNGLQLMKLASNNREAVEKARAMMERQVGHMVRLIDDLLDLSRVSQGNLELKQERIELAEVIRNAVETSQPLIEQMGHELILVVPAVPIYLDGDMSRLAQVISNLLNNSAKYTERGGRIRLCAEQLGSEIVVTVEDNGVGIPAHMLSKVFEMFTQVDRSLEMSKGGLGIGLSLVQRLVELHGGSVQAHSEGECRGSAIVVRLPVVLSLAGDRQEDGEVQPVRSPPRRRILVVDDNRDAAISLAELLTIMGNETQTAYDGLEALAVAAAFKPDVTLLDIGLPKLNGYEVCRRIRQQAWGKSMVLYALTGWGQEEDQQRSLAAGFDAHLVKPILAAELETLLSGLTAAPG